MTLTQHDAWAISHQVYPDLIPAPAKEFRIVLTDSEEPPMTIDYGYPTREAAREGFAKWQFMYPINRLMVMEG